MSKMFTLRVSSAAITVNMRDRHTLVCDVRDRLRRRSGFAIATLNLDHLVKLRREADFRHAYERQDLVTADGNPIVWLSRLAGRPVSLVTGSDLVGPLASLAAQEQVPVALFGSTVSTLARASAELCARNPGLRIVACLSPGQGFTAGSDEATRMIEALHQSGARLTFLALGAPRQEMFAARCRALLPEMGLVSVGAGLDFVAASQRRAPVWIRRIAMEWLWRAVSDPRRLAGRYASCAIALPSLTLSVLSDNWVSPRSVEPAKAA